MTRAEIEEIEIPALSFGATSSTGIDAAGEHDSHSFLYLPDLSSETGWAGHRVPDPPARQPARQSIGFRTQRARRA